MHHGFVAEEFVVRKISDVIFQDTGAISTMVG
jgi:hypothetical protein